MACQADPSPLAYSSGNTVKARLDPAQFHMMVFASAPDAAFSRKFRKIVSAHFALHNLACSEF
jgi:hypothetical protein